MSRKLAEDIEPGDTILLWTVDGSPRRVTEVHPYRGTLTGTDGWRTALWPTVPGVHLSGGATLIPGDEWEIA